MRGIIETDIVASSMILYYLVTDGNLPTDVIIPGGYFSAILSAVPLFQ